MLMVLSKFVSENEQCDEGSRLVVLKNAMPVFNSVSVLTHHNISLSSQPPAVVAAYKC